MRSRAVSFPLAWWRSTALGLPGVEGLVLAFRQVGQALGHGVFHAPRLTLPERARNWGLRTTPAWRRLLVEAKETRSGQGEYPD